MDAHLALASQISRNPGVPLDLSWLDDCLVNRSAVERRAATLLTRRTVKKEFQAQWLLRALSCMDLTSLAGDDSEGRIQRLCAKARHPLRGDLESALAEKLKGTANSMSVAYPVRVAAVCVYHEMVPAAIRSLEGSWIPVAAVSTGFPAGLSPFVTRLAEVKESVDAGASEIDVVISRRHALCGNWQELYDEIAQFREACGSAHLKVILATGDLGTLTLVSKASLVAMMAGADFIKTSTGKEDVNATLPVGLVMCRVIRDYLARTGYAIGFKPAGGIRTAKDAISWLILMKEELGSAWMSSQLLRLGASTLLADIERQLDHFVTQRYASFDREPMA